MAACRRSGEAGLTTKSNAPLRIAVTTVSMPPCAVCTMTGTSMPRSRMVQHDGHAVHARHDEVEDHDANVAAARPFERGERGLAAVGDDRLVAEAVDGRLQQAPLHGIIVDDEDRAGHRNPEYLPRRGFAVWINVAQGSK